MKEAILKDFFLGRVSPEALKKDLIGAVESEGKISRQYIEDMDSEFEVKSAHLVRVCDAVLDGILDPMDLSTIGFCLMASDYFEFDTDTEDGARVADAAIDWADYLINYDLNKETTKKSKERLITGKNLFTENDHYLDRHGRSKDKKGF
ncbi:hypothetical protein DESUT3_15970 [Desulfuromonas versatilis]|uniref:Uncharacterized protein n=2 Tax=Desulfuromonas versatilis TaxID=2802975 RepID=A0ABM8HVH9_9BACT|nr:hypothetical protein DESUT3_15970 [Desulfuromonas versatilis]